MAIKKRPVSPRQKMINLLYVVLMAMLALNISTEVINGFTIVEESLKRTTKNSSERNRAIYDDLKEQLRTNPEKVREWYAKASEVKGMSDSLYNFAQELKEAIARAADGPGASLDNIENKDNLEAASQVMLAPGTGRGRELYNAVNSFRTRIVDLVADPLQKRIINSNLSTEVPKNENTMGKNWQEYMFENMPVAAAITLLSKLQSDVRYAEGEVLHSLASNIGLKDIRVNKLEAFVVPSQTKMFPGDPFEAKIVMAAVDTTQRPEIYVNGARISGDTYSFRAGGIGDHSFSGYILMHDASGNTLRRDFTQKYTVIEPPHVPNSATVAADMMNVLYAGYDNPMSISVPGVKLEDISATMSGGSFRSTSPGHYIAVPSAVGQDVTINVSAKGNNIGAFTFHVRKLPDPVAYIPQGTDRFRGGGLSKAALMGSGGIKAAIDDGLLDIEFKVLGFETVFFDNMGNAVPMASAGAAFTERQKEQFRKLSRNKRFYVTRVKAVGPDGVTRTLPGAMEIIVK
ncbi:MAG: gliding motility protein GldM [Prevotella sp.]|nr:gliding motility protein GldM [Prevotella sp.]MCR5151562.1 gliding motility protein GldM [Prevotella sp.]